MNNSSVICATIATCLIQKWMKYCSFNANKTYDIFFGIKTSPNQAICFQCQMQTSISVLESWEIMIG